jgi:Ran GTPase-activating protein (RanGAP) involved in mRNA processing and transport
MMPVDDPIDMATFADHYEFYDVTDELRDRLIEGFTEPMAQDLIHIIADFSTTTKSKLLTILVSMDKSNKSLLLKTIRALPKNVMFVLVEALATQSRAHCKHLVDMGLKGVVDNQRISLARILACSCFNSDDERRLLIESIAIFNQMSGKELPGQILQEFTILLPENRLTRIDLSGQGFGNAGAVVLAAYLAETKSLKDLRLRHAGISWTGCGALAKSMQFNSSVVYLDISQNQFVDLVQHHTRVEKVLEGADFVAVFQLSKAIQRNRTLEVLLVSSNSIGTRGPTGIGAIGEAILFNTDVKSLDLSNNSICGAKGNRYKGFIKIAEALATNSTITDLSLADNSLNCDAAIIFAKGIEVNISIHTLDISGNNLSMDHRCVHSPHGFGTFCDSLKYNATLTFLNISRNQLGPENTECLSSVLEQNATIKMIDLSRNPLGPDGFFSIARALSLNDTLVDIICDECGLLEYGADFFAQSLLQNRKLLRASFVGNDFGDEGAQEILRALETNQVLEELKLDDNFINDDTTNFICQRLLSNLDFKRILKNPGSIHFGKDISLESYFNFTDKLLEIEPQVFDALALNASFSQVRIEGMRAKDYFASVGDVKKVKLLNRLYKRNKVEDLNLQGWYAAIMLQKRYRLKKGKRLRLEKMNERIAQEEAERMRKEKIERDKLEYRVATYLQSIVRSVLAKRLVARLQKNLYY